MLIESDHRKFLLYLQCNVLLVLLNLHLSHLLNVNIIVGVVDGLDFANILFVRAVLVLEVFQLKFTQEFWLHEVYCCCLSCDLCIY